MPVIGPSPFCRVTALGAVALVFGGGLRLRWLLRNEGAQPWHGVDDTLIPEMSDHLARCTASDPELSYELILGRDRLTRPVDAVCDAFPQLLGDLYPLVTVCVELHAWNVSKQPQPRTSGYQCG